MTKFPYSVKYRRTRNFMDKDGEWERLSTWCWKSYGWGNWEYINESFLFKTEQDKILFILRWL